MSEIKLCKDCKHYTRLHTSYWSYCGAGKIDLVHGEPCEGCRTARAINGSCGVEAKNFEQKPETRPDALKFDMSLHTNPQPMHSAGLGDFVGSVRPWWRFWR